MVEIPDIEINLDKPPQITQTGLCLHGSRAMESFRLHGLWSLHAYRYCGEIRLSKQTFPFRAGAVSLIPPDTLVEWHFPSHAPHYYAHFVMEPSMQSVTPLPLLQNLGEGFECFCEQFEQMISFLSHDPIRATARLWDMLHRLKDTTTTDHFIRSQHPSVQIALSLIRNPPSDHLTVGQIARAMGVSHNHLTQVFQKNFGCGVRQFIQRERLSRACHLLSHSSLAIKSVAIEIGIPDLQYFNKLIRKATGLSPRSYREAANIERPIRQVLGEEGRPI